MKLKLTASINRQSEAEAKREVLKNKYFDKIKRVFKAEDLLVPNIIDQMMDLSLECTKSKNEKGKLTYAEWIIQKFLQDDSELTPRLIDEKLEDASKIVEFLKPFHQLKDKPNLKLKKDINHYKTFSELADSVTPFLKNQTEYLETDEYLKNLKNRVGVADLPGLETLWHGNYKGDKYWVYQAKGTELETLDSLTLLAGKTPYVCCRGEHCKNKKSTKPFVETGTEFIEGQWYCGQEKRPRFGGSPTVTWCTITRSTNYDYLSRGPVTTICKNGEPWAQMHAKTNQFEDRTGKRILNNNSKLVPEKDLFGVLANVKNSVKMYETLVDRDLAEVLSKILGDLSNKTATKS